MADADPIDIGGWRFAPEAGELRRGEERRKLEHRAALTLELLCRRRGAIVSQDEIVAEVWNGRAVSPNSVPVVISDLRQALGDSARAPRHIETVAKRGYRLIADPAAPAAAGSRRGWRIPVAAAAILAALVAAALVLGGPPKRQLIVSDVVNATGRADMQPLAIATSEVILANAQRLDGIEVVRDGDDAVRLGARLVMWSGRPTVMMSAEDGGGRVIWTGMSKGGEDTIPRDVAAAVATLPAALGTH